MDIKVVTTKAELKSFIQLPYDLYKNDPVWVPPLRSEQWAQFNPAKNPMLNHCNYCLFLAIDQHKVVGRISAFIDSLATEAWGKPIGLFGSYECLDNPAASHALLDAARKWLIGQGMQAMRGPWSFASQEWGMVVEGFEPSPVILAPYNPPYYNDHMTSFGLDKIEDLLVYIIDAREGYQFPARYLELTDRIQTKYGIRVRPVDMGRIEEEVVKIVELSNLSIKDNWGYYPVTIDEARVMAHDLKSIINPKAILLAEDDSGKTIGFAMSLPDVNILLKGLNGRLFPFGWLKLLYGLPRLKQYRMWALGVDPAYHGKAIDTLLYRATYEAIFSKNLRLEINYVLEDNDKMNNALLKLGVKQIRRYRVYEMGLRAGV